MQRKALLGHLVDRYRVGIRRSCAVVKQSRSASYYQPRDNDDAPLLRRIEQIAAARVRYGFWRIYVLLRREGWKASHKRVYRLYYQADLKTSAPPQGCGPSPGAHGADRSQSSLEHGFRGRYVIRRAPFPGAYHRCYCGRFSC